MTAPARLLALRLQGFKSFAERTVVEFGPGGEVEVGLVAGAGGDRVAGLVVEVVGGQGEGTVDGGALKLVGGQGVAVVDPAGVEVPVGQPDVAAGVELGPSEHRGWRRR